MTTGKTYAEDLRALTPTPRAEGWRYADLSLIRSREPTLAAKGTAPKAPAPVTDWPVITIGNGQVTKGPDPLPGIEISYTPASGQKPVTGREEHPLAVMADRHADSGLTIKVKKDVNLEGLEVIFVEDGPGGGARHFKNRIVLEAGSKASLFLRTFNRRENGWANTVTRVVLEKQANLDLAFDFEAGPMTLVSNLVEVEIEASGTLNMFSLGGGLVSLRHEVDVSLKGKGAAANLSGGLLAGAGETIDILTRVHHASGATSSNQVFKGVAGAGGRTAFQGRVVVEEDAQKIEAHQNCHNLILERGGEANVKPELLIFADDVVCSHGATVGEVDEDALFYMMQRGIPEKDARAILVQTFLGEAIEAAGDEQLRSHFTARAAAWMEGNLS